MTSGDGSEQFRCVVQWRTWACCAKNDHKLGALIACWGCAMQAGANNVATLLIGRIVAGVAIGCLSMSVPLYNVRKVNSIS
jgi:hypothetical protein